MTITVKESMKLDINYRYLHGSVEPLMANAGQAVAQEIIRHYPDARSILIFCGSGNKAGDSIFAAKSLGSRMDVRIFFIRGEESIHSDSVKNLLRSIRFQKVSRNAIPDEIKNADILMDGLLGTGLKGDPSSEYSDIIRMINDSGKPVISVDVPSGAGSKISVRPEITVAMHAVKAIPGYRYPGDVIVKDIGFDKGFENIVGPGDFLSYILPEKNSHKGQNGVLGIVAGFEFPGAAIVSALGAEKVGVDLIRIYTKNTHSGLIQGYSPFLIMRDIEDLKGIEKSTALLIGPGMGHTVDFKQVFQDLLSLDIPTVIDADAIRILSLLNYKRSKPLLITPHSAEFKDLTGMEASESALLDYSRKTGNIVILKGSTDLISDGNVIALSSGGNARMTMGGTGDLLAGISASLLSKGIAPFEAAKLASFINKKTGEMCFDDRKYWYTIMDMVEKIPDVMNWLDAFCQGK